MELTARLNEAKYGYIKVRDEIEKMTYFINGLHPSIKSIVAWFREIPPRWLLAYKQLVQFERGERESIHMQSQVTCRIRPFNVCTYRRYSSSHCSSGTNLTRVIRRTSRPSRGWEPRQVDLNYCPASDGGRRAAQLGRDRFDCKKPTYGK